MSGPTCIKPHIAVRCCSCYRFYYLSRSTIWSSAKYLPFHFIEFCSVPYFSKPNISYSFFAFKLSVSTIKLICSISGIVFTLLIISSSNCLAIQSPRNSFETYIVDRSPLCRNFSLSSPSRTKLATPAKILSE